MWQKEIHYGRNLCGTCYNRWWREENTEYYKEHVAEYRAKNRERFKEYQHKWYLDNRERLLEKQQQYDQGHRGECQDCGAEISRYGVRCRSCTTKRQWDNPEQRERLSDAIRKWDIACIRCSNHQAKIKGLCKSCYSTLRHRAGGTYGLSLVERLCFYCSNPAEHWDHFVPAAAGGKSHRANMVPACASCNSRKHSKLPQDYLSQLAFI